MLALADLTKTTLLESVSFDLTYLKVTTSKVSVLFPSTFCFQVSIFVSPSHSYIKVLYMSPDGCCTRLDIYYFTLYLF